MTERHVFIDGKWSQGGGEVFENLCPATGDVTWAGRAATPDQVASATDSARRAFHGWARTPVGERLDVLRRYADALKARKTDIAETISRDMGKVLWDAEGEAGAMVGKIEISIRAMDERAGQSTSETAFGSAHLSHRPHGVMAVLGPFNFPGHLPNGHVVPALLAGNTCVHKPSEQAPGVAAIMAECLAAAGLPDGCFNIVQGGRDAGAALLEQDIDGLLFTGSSSAGLYFHKHFAGRPEVILALEMGGNNPLIIWEPADVDAAADIAAQSAFLTTGQRCSDARRLILPEGVFGDRVVDALVARAEGLRIGAWNEDDVFMGPLVSAEAAKAATDFQDMLVSMGGRIIKPLERLERGHGFVSAGVVDVTDAKSVPDEELFGPLLQVIRVPDFDTAISVSNATKYGLAGGLVSDDDALWARAEIEMRAGILNRNRPTAGASGAMPFGGPGHSGNFRPGAYYAADYCAWPQAQQIAPKAARIAAKGFPG